MKRNLDTVTHLDLERGECRRVRKLAEFVGRKHDERETHLLERPVKDPLCGLSSVAIQGILLGLLSDSL